MWPWLAALTGLGVASAIAVNLYVYWNGSAHVVPAAQAQPADAALVLGAYVYPDGTPSAMLADRLDTALDLYRAGKVRKLLLSGDHGRTDYDEVNAMRRYLEQRGVPEPDIFMDHAGFNTYASMYRARDVFRVRRVLVVTQRFHLTRALYLARQLGLQAEGVEADRRPYTDYYEVREMAARVKAFLDVQLGTRPDFLGPAIPISGDGRATRG